MTIINQIQDSLRTASIRHEVLSDNIAHANAPGYKSKDLSPNQPSFSSSLSIKMTNSMHLQGIKKQSMKINTERHGKHLKPNGNNVYLPEQIAKISQNQTNHQKLLKMYSYLEDMLKTAIGK